MPAPSPAAVVTGGARGIGFAIARELVRHGYMVVIADRDPERGPQAARLLAREGSARFRSADVSDEEDVQALIAEAAEDQGGLDLLVNNAAIADPESGPVAALTPADWHRRLATNLTSAYLATHFAVPALRARGGNIVNVASTRAMQSEPGCEAYAAAKGGLVSLTHALAVSLGPAIRVNAVSPGWIDTSTSPTDAVSEPEPLRPVDHAQHPAGRVGRPEDVAEAVVWLASPAASFITGHNLIVDGGMTRRMQYAE